MDSLRSTLQKSGFTPNRRVYLSQSVPSKHLDNAARSYGIGSKIQFMVVMVDNTMLGSGKDGCLLFEDRIIIRESFADPVTFLYSQIKSLVVSGSKLIINGRKAVDFQMLDAPDVNALFSIVEKWLLPIVENSGVGTSISAPVSAPISVERTKNNLEFTIVRFRTIFRFLHKDKARPIAEHAIEYFEFLKENLRTGEFVTEVQAESDLIYLLSDHFIEVHSGRETLRPELMKFRSDDSLLVQMLRGMLVVLKEHEDENTKNNIIDDFMR